MTDDKNTSPEVREEIIEIAEELLNTHIEAFLELAK